MRYFLLMVCLFLSLRAQAQEPILSSYEIKNPDALTMQLVNRLFAIESRDGDIYEVIVPKEQANLLLSIAPQARLVDLDTAASNRARLQSFRKDKFLQAEDYHSLQQVQDWMKQTAFDHPQFAQTFTYGKSGAGRDLMALRLNVGNAAKPVLMITAATHGDELITTEVLMRLVDKLVAGYGRDARLTAMLDRHDIYFVPVLNVDGFSNTSRFDGRQDPNRSYPYPGHEQATPTPSIAGIISLFERIRPVGSIDFHAYGEMIMYPWAYTHDPIDAESAARLNALTKSMAETNNYAYGPISDVIYVAPGSSADYYFWKNHTMGLGIEMGSQKIPYPSEIPSYVQALEESTWRFIEAF